MNIADHVNKAIHTRSFCAAQHVFHLTYFAVGVAEGWSVVGIIYAALAVFTVFETVECIHDHHTSEKV